jgi:hypothetical protein
MDAVALDERLHVVDTGVDTGWDLRQARVGRGHAHRTQCVAAELSRSLGELVGLALPLLGQLIEEQVQLIEVDALHIPVGLLGLAIQISGVRQLLIEQLDHGTPGRGGEIDRRFEGPRELGPAIAVFHEVNFGFVFGHAAPAPFVCDCRVWKRMHPACQTAIL